MEGDPKAPVSIAIILRKGATPFPGLLHFTLDPYLIKLSVKQGGIKYHFLSLWYDSTWDWQTLYSLIFNDFSSSESFCVLIAHFSMVCILKGLNKLIVIKFWALFQWGVVKCPLLCLNVFVQIASLNNVPPSIPFWGAYITNRAIHC